MPGISYSKAAVEPAMKVQEVMITDRLRVAGCTRSVTRTGACCIQAVRHSKSLRLSCATLMRALRRGITFTSWAPNSETRSRKWRAFCGQMWPSLKGSHCMSISCVLGAVGIEPTTFGLNSL